MECQQSGALEMYLGVEIRDCKTQLLESFKKLVDDSKDDTNRFVDNVQFQLVNNLMLSVYDDLHHNDEHKWIILVEIYRYLRNLLSQSRLNQDGIRGLNFMEFTVSKILSSGMTDELFNSLPEAVPDRYQETLRAALQFTGNFLIGNRNNVRFYLQHFDEEMKVLRALLKHKDKYVRMYAMMSIYCIINTRSKSFVHLHSEDLVRILNDYEATDDVYYKRFIWEIVKENESPQMLFRIMNNELLVCYRITIYQILNLAGPDRSKSFSITTLNHLKEEYLKRVEAIMNSPSLGEIEELGEITKILTTATSIEMKTNEGYLRKHKELISRSFHIMRHFFTSMAMYIETKQDSAVREIRNKILCLIKNFDFGPANVYERAKEVTLMRILIEIHIKEAKTNSELGEIIYETLQNMVRDNKMAETDLKKFIRSKKDYNKPPFKLFLA